MNRLYFKCFFLFVIVASTISCKKYLDVKPDKALVVPETLEDCENILGNFSVMNQNYPVDGEASGDNYFLSQSSWTALLNQEDKDTYIWTPQGQHLATYWGGAYKTVFYANIVLETLGKIKPTPNQSVKYNTLKGSALFFRAFAFYQIAQVYANTYDANTADNALGIPLRLNSNIDEKTVRSTMQQTYNQILNDFKEASDLLPATASIRSQPNKAAGYAALARTYLSMRDYSNAGLYADLSLKSYNTLLDYNNISKTATNPFTIFNDEIIFQSRAASSNLLLTSNSKIDNDLIDSYLDGDLRKDIFFRKNTDGVTYQFKGNYSASASLLFNGFAVDEMYLVKAECAARANNTSTAMENLNILLKARWDKTKYNPLTAADSKIALRLILDERRKELLFRHLRFTDLKRLNKESDFAKTIRRTLGTTVYELPPNDLRYAILIPNTITSSTGILQNPR